ncbi:hypothetical protein [Paraburkholderia antibiotica]|uniref:Uncharacterized protein n=1 Tax=Paraburkholderia antibiotica TaxID=2728839 RepID=A0A7Y0A145_9BURK|nr:hypothetical protein [Paraburkholderia antibiotica]NML34552.1 hypothetical protein [Paraburkholderia antibiotica]
MQTDLFGELAPAPVDERQQARERLQAAIAAQPEVLRPSCVPATPMPTTKPELDAWVRTTQRIYLLYLVGAIQRLKYRDSSIANARYVLLIANARYVLLKLNGMGGQW